MNVLLTSYVYTRIAIAKLHKINMRILCILFQVAMPRYLIECVYRLICCKTYAYFLDLGALSRPNLVRIYRTGYDCFILAHIILSISLIAMF